MSRLARSHRIVFVEEPIFTEAPAHWVVTQPAPGVEVLSPHTPLPAQGFTDDQMPGLQRMLSGWVHQQGIVKPLVWLYTPMALPLAKNLAADGLVSTAWTNCRRLPAHPPPCWSVNAP